MIAPTPRRSRHASAAPALPRLVLVATFLLLINACAPRAATTVASCSSRSDRAACSENPANCPCEAYGDCGMEGCRTRGEEVAAARDAATSSSSPSPTATPSSPTAVAATTVAAPGCASVADRAACRDNPADCPCEAYGDCGMEGCRTRGEEVAAARDAATAPPTPPASTAPAPTRPSPPVATPPASAPPPTTTGTGSSCRTAGDRRQCAEESYWCPCEAYGDCGMACCKEPTTRPREVGCRTESDRDLCRTDSARCPCPVGGACGMPGCS